MGLLLLTAAFLLIAPWVFVLGPVVALLFVSRPASRPEWIALALAAPLLALALLDTGNLFPQFVRALGAMLTGAFVVLMLARPGPVFRRAVLAAVIAGVGTLIWSAYLGFGWPDVQISAAREIHDFLQLQAQAAGAQGARGVPAQQLFNQVAARSADVAALFPAILALTAVAGVGLAWRLYGAVASRPIAPPAAPFAQFRFGDQWVWVPVVALAALLLPVPQTIGALSITLLARNVLLVAAVLYAARGLAVFSTLGRQAPGLVLLVLTLVAVLLMPFALSGLALLGLADSWVDFRRRLTPPTPGGTTR